MEELILTTIQNLKTDETVTSSNDNSDPNISGKLLEKETAYHICCTGYSHDWALPRYV